MKFVVIDVETANYAPTSICSIGLTVVEDAQIKDTYYQLVKPVPFEVNPKHEEIHGLSEKMLSDAPTFDIVWEEISQYFNRYNFIVAHNAQFDMGCLKATLEHYNIHYQNFIYICTMLYARYSEKINTENCKLKTLCDAFGIENERPHCADSDSFATAQLFIKYLNTLEDCENLYDIYCNGYGKSIYDLGIPNYNKKTRFDNVKIKEIEPQNNTFDLDSPIFDKSFVITGELSSMTRKEAYQAIIDKGGHINANVTLKTNYLVNNNVGTVVTGKLKKALELQERGQNIKIIDESSLLKMLES